MPRHITGQLYEGKGHSEVAFYDTPPTLLIGLDYNVNVTISLP